MVNKHQRIDAALRNAQRGISFAGNAMLQIIDIAIDLSAINVGGITSYHKRKEA